MLRHLSGAWTGLEIKLVRQTNPLRLVFNIIRSHPGENRIMSCVLVLWIIAACVKSTWINLRQCPVVTESKWAIYFPMAPRHAHHKLKLLSQRCWPSSICTTCFLKQSQQKETKTGSTTASFFSHWGIHKHIRNDILFVLISATLQLKFTDCFPDPVNREHASGWISLCHN